MTRLLSMLSLSMSPECLATVTVTSTPFFRRILVHTEGRRNKLKLRGEKRVGVAYKTVSEGLPLHTDWRMLGQ